MRFSGPLFIVGKPRSGTKLLRTLLNEHPLVAIPISETNFFPLMIDTFGDPPALDREDEFASFYKMFSDSVFFDWRRKHNVVLAPEELRQRANLNSWPSIFETILKYYAPKRIDKGVIWGDKSPSYLRHIPLIKSLFPTARFLHIIRDPRDHCLSVRKAWGKHVYRTADVWQKDVSVARADGAELGLDYCEVTFESLLEDTEQTLRDVCEFLDIEYTDRMLNLSVSHEDRGDAKGELKIIANNKAKYSSLGRAVIKRIEEIVYPTAAAVGYEPDYADQFRPLSGITRQLLQIHDGLAMTGFYIKDKGLRWGIKYFWHGVFRRTNSQRSPMTRPDHQELFTTNER